MNQKKQLESKKEELEKELEKEKGKVVRLGK